MFFQLKILNSYWVTLAYSTITLPSAVWIMVAHFKRIPISVEEAAKIDGCSQWQTLWKVIFPMFLSGIGIFRKGVPRLTHTAGEKRVANGGRQISSNGAHLGA